jgi:hypothetical protein
MRNLIVTCAVLAVLAACGGGSREAALAKTARYKGDKLEIFNAMKASIESKYQVAQSDENTLTVITTNRWYTPEGLVTTSGEQDIRQVPDKSLLIGFNVKQVPDGDSFLIVIDARILRIQKGSPAPEPRNLKSADLPGWVPSKADQLALDIHTALAKWEQKSPGGVAPPPTSAPAPAPAPAPDAGSAAPAPTP